METTVEAIDHTINGNGQPGFVSEASAYISEQRGSWKTLKLLGGIFALIITLLLGWLTYRDAQRRTELLIPHAANVTAPQDATAIATKP